MGCCAKKKPQQLLEKMLPEQFDTWPPVHQNRFYKQNAYSLLKLSFLFRAKRAPWWALRTLVGPNQQHLHQLIGNKLVAKGIIILSAIQIVGLVVLSGYGFWIVRKKNFPAFLFLLIYSVFFWATSAWFASAYARFRAPFEFVLCITAALAFEKICVLQAHRKTIR